MVAVEYLPHYIMGLRHVLFLGLTIGGLYTIHLLAQDYNRIRPMGGPNFNPNQIIAPLRPLAGQAMKFLTSLSRMRRDTPQSMSYAQDLQNNIDWSGILKKDVFSCALSFVCQVAAGAEERDEDAIVIMQLVRASFQSQQHPVRLKDAHDLGLASRPNASKCINHFVFCPYSARIMLKLIKMHNILF